MNILKEKSFVMTYNERIFESEWHEIVFARDIFLGSVRKLNKKKQLLF